MKFEELMADSQELKNLLQKSQELTKRISSLERELNETQHLIYNETKKFPSIYGRCIKELKCHHQSYEFNTSDSTIIKVGDIIEFSNHPLENHVTFNPNSGEYFDVPRSNEYFSFFASSEYVEHLSFNRD